MTKGFHTHVISSEVQHVPLKNETEVGDGKERHHRQLIKLRQRAEVEDEYPSHQPKGHLPQPGHQAAQQQDYCDVLQQPVPPRLGSASNNHCRNQ